MAPIAAGIGCQHLAAAMIQLTARLEQQSRLALLVASSQADQYRVVFREHLAAQPRGRGKLIAQQQLAASPSL